MNEELYRLSEYLVESYDQLKFGSASGCRCLSCYAFKLIDLDDKVTFEADTLTELVAMLPKV